MAGRMNGRGGREGSVRGIGLGARSRGLGEERYFRLLTASSAVAWMLKSLLRRVIIKTS